MRHIGTDDCYGRRYRCSDTFQTAGKFPYDYRPVQERSAGRAGRPGIVIAVFAVTLLAASPPAAAFPLDCAYVARGGELEPHGPCARIEDDVPHIDPAHLARMTFEGGLAEVRIGGARTGGGIAYVRRDGRAVSVFILDNGPDYFREGLVRGLRHGKLIYYDHALRPVIVTGYDWGYPFDHGRADVCTGCKEQRLDDEHSTMGGGRWAVIDRTGRERASAR